MSKNLNILKINEGFSDKKKEEKKDEKKEKDEEEEISEEELIDIEKKKKTKEEKKNDLILKEVKEDFITKMLGDGLIQKKKKKNKETFEINIPKYKIDTNIDKKIDQLDNAIQLFKQKIG
jgi:hypothetical protein